MNVRQIFVVGVVAVLFGTAFVYVNRDWQPPARAVEDAATNAAGWAAGETAPPPANLLPEAPTVQQIAEYDALHIVPFGATVGEYANLPTDVLKQRSFNDDRAALVLARRADDAGEQLNWYLRAAGLSGRPGPLMELAYNRYAVSAAELAGATLDTLKSRLVLETVAARLGDPRARPDYWRAQIARSHPDADLAWLADKTEDILTHMSIIQRHAKGEGTIQALLD